MNGIDLPPQNLVAERSVIGSILLDNRCYDEISEKLKPGHFYSDVHAKMYEIVGALLNSGGGVDTVTLAERLDELGILEDSGGVPYIVELLESVPHSAHVEHYAAIVRDRHDLRELQSICQKTLRSIAGETGDSRESIDAHELAVSRLGDMRISDGTDTSIKSILVETLQKLDDRVKNPSGIVGIATGITGFDQLTTGLRPSELIILAARPSMGKTALVCNLADHMANEDAKGATIFFSLEQSRTELSERFLSIRSRVNGQSIRKGRLEPDELCAVRQASRDMSDINLLHIDDKPNRSIADMRSIARNIKRKQGLACIIVDYLQLVEPEDKKGTRENQVSAIARGLKCLAKEHEIPVIALSQLNRGVELRDDKRPRLADLRESGAIEQDADIVTFLHRPDAYNPDDQPGLAEWIVAKHRAGPTDIIKMRWNKTVMRFEDWVEPADESNSQQF